MAAETLAQAETKRSISKSHNSANGVGVVSGCPICGGRLALIRGRYPKDEKRNVCPTCLQEKIEDINDITACSNYIGAKKEA